MPLRSARTPTGLLLIGAFVAAAVLLAWPVRVAGASVHKCRDAAGQLSYQDEPCPPGTALDTPVLAPEPPWVAPAPVVPLARETGANTAPPPYEAPPPLPKLYRCDRYDGQESYVTTDPVPRQYQVPLWSVLPDRTGLAGGGVSVSRGASGGAAGRSMLGAYTTVQDRCHAMARAELCAYWGERFESVRKQLARAFNDTRPRLEQEEAGLRENRAVHCGI